MALPLHITKDAVGPPDHRDTMAYSERKPGVSHIQLIIPGHILLEKALWFVFFWDSDKVIIMLISGLHSPESEPKTTCMGSFKHRFGNLHLATYSSSIIGL